MSKGRHADDGTPGPPARNATARPIAVPVPQSNLSASVADARDRAKALSHEAVLSEYGFLLHRHLDAPTLLRAASLASAWRTSVHRVLIDHGWIDEAGYADALAAWLGVARARGRTLDSAAPSGAGPFQATSYAMQEAGEPRLVVLALTWPPSVLARFLRERAPRR